MKTKIFIQYKDQSLTLLPLCNLRTVHTNRRMAVYGTCCVWCCSWWWWVTWPAQRCQSAPSSTHTVVSSTVSSRAMKWRRLCANSNRSCATTVAPTDRLNTPVACSPLCVLSAMLVLQPRRPHAHSTSAFVTTTLLSLSELPPSTHSDDSNALTPLYASSYCLLTYLLTYLSFICVLLTFCSTVFEPFGSFNSFI